MAINPEKEKSKIVIEHLDKGWVHQENLWENAKKLNKRSVGDILRRPSNKKKLIEFFLRKLDKKDINNELRQKIDYSIKILDSLTSYKPTEMDENKFKEYMSFVAKKMPADKKVFHTIIETIKGLLEIYKSKINMK